jgi:hypothetical protein
MGSDLGRSRDDHHLPEMLPGGLVLQSENGREEGLVTGLLLSQQVLGPAGLVASH